ncbi:hypothetical protein BJ546DRAFT_968071 [Cryomyces antarcticus]
MGNLRCKAWLWWIWRIENYPVLAATTIICLVPATFSVSYAIPPRLAASFRCSPTPFPIRESHSTQTFPNDARFQCSSFIALCSPCSSRPSAVRWCTLFPASSSSPGSRCSGPACFRPGILPELMRSFSISAPVFLWGAAGGTLSCCCTAVYPSPDLGPVALAFEADMSVTGGTESIDGKLLYVGRTHPEPRSLPDSAHSRPDVLAMLVVEDSHLSCPPRTGPASGQEIFTRRHPSFTPELACLASRLDAKLASGTVRGQAPASQGQVPLRFQKAASSAILEASWKKRGLPQQRSPVPGVDVVPISVSSPSRLCASRLRSLLSGRGKTASFVCRVCCPRRCGAVWMMSSDVAAPSPTSRGRAPASNAFLFSLFSFLFSLFSFLSQHRR